MAQLEEKRHFSLLEEKKKKKAFFFSLSLKVCRWSQGLTPRVRVGRALCRGRRQLKGCWEKFYLLCDLGDGHGGGGWHPHCLSVLSGFKKK